MALVARPPRADPFSPKSSSLPRPAPSSSVALASRFDLLVTDRLFAPRTGVLGVKIQPTPGTGLPPMSLPGSNSQGRSA